MKTKTNISSEMVVLINTATESELLVLTNQWYN